MTTIKMMSGEDKPDSRSDKGFTLYEVPVGAVVATGRTSDNEPLVTVEDDGEMKYFYPEGNTYFLEKGKTVATFAHTCWQTLEEVEQARVADQQAALLQAEILKEMGFAEPAPGESAHVCGDESCKAQLKTTIGEF